MKINYKIFLVTLICFANQPYCYGLNVDPIISGGDLIGHTTGMSFDNGSGTASDPRTIGSNTTADSVNLVEWNSFNISPGEYVKFLFNSTGQTILNYLDATIADPAKASVINGTMQVDGDGRVILANPNGIYLNGANVTSLTNAGEFAFTTLGYDSLGASIINFDEIQNIDGNLIGTEINNSKISGFDTNTIFGPGVKILNSNITANNNAGIMTSSYGYLDLTDDTYYLHSPDMSSQQVYYPNLHYSNSYAAILVDNNSTIEVLDGTINIENYIWQDPQICPSIIEIQGTLEATTAVEGAGGITLISGTLTGDYYSATNITGTLKTSNNNPITINNGQIQSYDYDITYSDTPIHTTPAHTQSTGNIITSDINNLTVEEAYHSVDLPYTDVQTGVNKVTRTYTNPDTDPTMEGIFNYIYGPQPAPAPVAAVDAGGGSNAAAAIAIPLGIAGLGGIGALISSGFFATPPIVRQYAPINPYSYPSMYTSGAAAPISRNSPYIIEYDEHGYPKYFKQRNGQ